VEVVLNSRMEELLEASRAPSIIQAFNALWMDFEDFAKDLHRAAMPALR